MNENYNFELLLQALTLAFSQDELTHSAYDIAMVSLVEGPQQKQCIKWLLENQHANGTWGYAGALSWYDTYICTYAAAIALYNAGLIELSEQAKLMLPRIIEGCQPILNHETIAFGTLVGVIDHFCQLKKWPDVYHPAIVQTVVDAETAKWQKVVKWHEFYNPALSAAGFCAERLYGNNEIDWQRFLAAFQIGNGSITGSPAASAMVLLELTRHHQSVPVQQLERLKEYIYSCNPYKRIINNLDEMPYFTTAWMLMFISELKLPFIKEKLTPINAHIELLHKAFLNRKNVFELIAVADNTLPGDADSTVCAMMALQYAGYQVLNLEGMEFLFVAEKGYYQNFLHERNPSLSLNIHMAAALALTESPSLDKVLVWLQTQIQQSIEINCKWHISPIYSMGEITRILGHIKHSIAYAISQWSANYLLKNQHSDGGWGVANSTVEETGYAIMGLASFLDAISDKRNINDLRSVIYKSLQKGQQFMQNAPLDYTPLWLGKSLYCLKQLVPILHTASIIRVQSYQDRFS